MLLIRASAGPSSIHGTGLFAREPIAAGAVIWQFTPGVDEALTRAELDRWPVEKKEQLRRFIYIDIATGMYVLCGDDARYMNHADAPNTRTEGERTFATRDIPAGEELTCDYREFDAATRARHLQVVREFRQER